MTAARLEELAQKCVVAIDGVGRNASYGLSADDLHDAARCARGWAKVERMKGQVSMEHTVPCYFWRNSDGRGDYRVAQTALEAVEAAEVGK